MGSWGMRLLLLIALVRIFALCGLDRGKCVDRRLYGNREEGIVETLSVYRAAASRRVESFLPSPHSELVSGMVLGENNLNLVPMFNDVVKKVGVVHVVVVSGYNINLLYLFILKFFGTKYRKRNLFIALTITLIYAVFSGFGAPAVRAWLMNGVTAIGCYLGKESAGVKALIFSSLLMLVISPVLVVSVSFQLSVLATFGLMVFPKLLTKMVTSRGKSMPFYLEDFVTSLSAQIMVLPILSYYFGTISVLSLIANPLVLWTVPVSTVLGSLLIISSYLCPLLATLVALAVFPFLDFFVQVVNHLAHYSFASLNISFSFLGVLGCYVALFLLYRLATKLLRGDDA